MVAKYEKSAVDFPRLRQLMADRGVGAAFLASLCGRDKYFLRDRDRCQYSVKKLCHGVCHARAYGFRVWVFLKKSVFRGTTWHKTPPRARIAAYFQKFRGFGINTPKNKKARRTQKNGLLAHSAKKSRRVAGLFLFDRLEVALIDPAVRGAGLYTLDVERVF